MQRAHSLSALGDANAAADGFRDAITRLRAGYHRDRGIYLARAAVARAGAGDLDHGAALGMQALSVGTETMSARVFTELATLDSRLARQPAPPAAARSHRALDKAVLNPAWPPGDADEHQARDRRGPPGWNSPSAWHTSARPRKAPTPWELWS